LNRDAVQVLIARDYSTAFYCVKQAVLLPLSSWLSETPLERNLEQSKGLALLTYQENIR